MKTSKLIFLIIIVYTSLNGFAYFLFGFPFLYLPFGFKLYDTNNLFFVLIPISFIILIFLCRKRSKFSPKLKNSFLIVVLIVTFVQMFFERNKFTSLTINKDIVLHNYTEFEENSVTLQLIKKDMIQTYNELEGMFPKKNLINKKPLKISLFSSKEKFNNYCKTPKSRYAQFNYLNNTLYIPITFWNQVFKHELVHYFQSQRMYFSFAEFVYYWFLEPPVRRESLAYYFSQNIPEVDFGRPVDYFNATNIQDKKSVETISKPKNIRLINAKNKLATAYLASLSANPTDVIDLYYKNVLPDEKKSDQSLNMSNRDTLTEKFIAYKMKGLLSVNYENSLNLFFSPKAYKDSIRSNGVDQHTFSTISYNLKNCPNLKWKVEWEGILDSLKNENSAHNEFKSDFGKIIDSGFNHSLDLKKKTDELSFLYEKCIEKNYFALAARIYFYWFEASYFLNKPLRTPINKEVLNQFNLCYQEYINTLNKKIYTQRNTITNTNE